jgi:hypothetical protein
VPTILLELVKFVSSADATARLAIELVKGAAAHLFGTHAFAKCRVLYVVRIHLSTIVVVLPLASAFAFGVILDTNHGLVIFWLIFAVEVYDSDLLQLYFS